MIANVSDYASRKKIYVIISDGDFSAIYSNQKGMMSE
jgi:hypothetical protein